ncbi:hypothetical protein F5Y06DRAFT_68627 [Hypoxylon sp. FL0890]|nr:hypothetical protein F5Y06DRAFT_68627 [Hypoxylon sp. FL0890]
MAPNQALVSYVHLAAEAGGFSCYYGLFPIWQPCQSTFWICRAEISEYVILSTGVLLLHAIVCGRLHANALIELPIWRNGSV